MVDETRFIINNFNELSGDVQEEIQNYISGITPMFEIEDVINDE